MEGSNTHTLNPYKNRTIKRFTMSEHNKLFRSQLGALSLSKFENTQNKDYTYIK